MNWQNKMEKKYKIQRNFAIKREQNDACINYVEREQNQDCKSRINFAIKRGQKTKVNFAEREQNQDCESRIKNTRKAKKNIKRTQIAQIKRIYKEKPIKPKEMVHPVSQELKNHRDTR